ncbi:MAG: hypothetical protein JXR40_09425 [Pontiellaceae bacterium]|nr:hypothetical protein [Pontiellaceae bacterium]
MKVKISKPLLWAGAGVCGIILVTVVSAEVFRTNPAGASAAKLNNGVYRWENAYTTTMTVNGRKSEVELYSVHVAEPVLAQLKDRFEQMGARVSITPGPDGATGTARWSDREARFLVLSPKEIERQLVFVFYPELGTVPQPVTFPVPQYQAVTVCQTISDDESGMFLATLSTTDEIAGIHRFYAEQMAAEGWGQVAAAPVIDGVPSGMAVYMKGTEVCYVQAVDRGGRDNMITLLVKGGKL